MESEEPTATGMSLDVLAQVASETLENEPNSPQKILPQKVCRNCSTCKLHKKEKKILLKIWCMKIFLAKNRP